MVKWEYLGNGDYIMELNEKIILSLANSLNISEKQVKVVLELLDDKATVPFIARYRKEMTGGLDEDQIRQIAKEYEYKVDLENRKEAVIRLIDEKGMLTEELKQSILACEKLVDVEDLYMPYKEKKKTKATEAIRLGLEPLADEMLKLYIYGTRENIAGKYLSAEVTDVEDAIKNACYIIAEKISDDAHFRKALRESLQRYGHIQTKKKKDAVDEDEHFSIYYDYDEALSSIKPHRVLAINRAEALKIINVSIVSNDEKNIQYIERGIIRRQGCIFEADLKAAILDAYKRLLYPSIEREVRGMLTDVAEAQAIDIFAMNVKNLLLQAPVKDKVVLGVDPAFRTGCKLAVVSKTGKVLEKGVIYPNEKAKGQTVDDKLVASSKKKIIELVNKYSVDIITIGNGTASRETESFINEVIKEGGLHCQYAIVSEAGASVYSASAVAQEEFPDYKVEERSAVSIARRLQDPLAELVKIEPKAIGVGQYQHDVSQSKLNEQLDFVVTEAVNKVGVNVNTASKSLLSYVSGLSKSIAQNIITRRDEIGEFKKRSDLLKVSKLGPKTYEQAIGFLRIIDGEEPLDKTSIHPESYEKAYRVLELLNSNINELGTNELKEKIEKANFDELLEKSGLDKYTLSDILDSFKSPLRDIRDSYEGPVLRSDIRSLEDLKIGDELVGTVRNVVDFGCFVDCGVKYDGLVHLSKMSDKFVKHPSDIVSVGQQVKVYVIDVDLKKHKLALSMIRPQ